MTDESRRVFLSHTREEQPYVRAVAEELVRHGVDPWSFADQPAAGATVQERVEDALRSSRVVVVFLTRAALASPSLNFEIGAAVGADKPLIPVFLSMAARRAAPRIVLQNAGIEAFDLKPEEVAEQIATALDASAAAT